MATFHVIGVGFGDEGKGTAVDYLARQLENPLVIRATSGPQAAHNVVLPDGTFHTFSQFGSGFFAGADTIYAAPVCDPIAFLNEAESLKSYDSKVYGRVTVSADCLLVTPYHQAANRLKEILRDSNRFGSCGVGVNEAVTMARNNNVGLTVGDLFERDDIIAARLEAIRDRYESLLINIVDYYELGSSKELLNIVDFICSQDLVVHVIALFKDFKNRFKVKSGRDIKKEISEAKNRIFESAQGVLLDPKHGFFFPNVTRLSAFDVMPYLNDRNFKTVLCTRTYMSRHGAGPFLSESEDIIGSDPHNAPNDWQSSMRYGYLDIPSIKYSIDVMRANGALSGLSDPKLFVTHQDVINKGSFVSGYNGSESITEVIKEKLKSVNVADTKAAIATGNNFLNSLIPNFEESNNLAETLESKLGIRVGWISEGPTYKHKVEY